MREQADHWLPQVKGVPVVAVSGLTGEGLDRLMQAVLDAHEVWNRRVGTSGLNRWLADVVAAHPPPAVSGRRIRLDYVTQPKSRPPTFALFMSRADAVPDAYRRYLVNSLRDSFASARHAHPAHAAGEEESLCEKEVPGIAATVISAS